MMFIIGIDPGQTGAIAILDDAEPRVFDMPIAGGQVDGANLSLLLAGEQGTCVIEDVHSMPKQGVASSFKFGRNLGIAIGCAASQGHRLIFVSPQKWKRHFGLGRDKDDSRRRAIELFPSLAPALARKKDDGRAEALLIAQYYLETF